MHYCNSANGLSLYFFMLYNIKKAYFGKKLYKKTLLGRYIPNRVKFYQYFVINIRYFQIHQDLQ
jgi:hypothetical protein